VSDALSAMVTLTPYVKWVAIITIFVFVFLLWVKKTEEEGGV